MADRATFNDVRHLVVYGQRTADGRLAFGSRGAPYRYGSSIRSAEFDPPAITEAVRARLVDLFPSLADTPVTHGWSGVLGVPRDWTPSVGLDRARGAAWAGGFVGEGVAASHLAGATLADLILERATDLVDLPWVDHRSRRWAPEPLRWLGVNGALRIMSSADDAEARTGRPSRRARLLWGALAR